MKKIIFLLNFVFLFLNGAESKSRVQDYAAEIAAAEVKVSHEHLQAAQFSRQADQRVIGVVDLLSQKLPVQHRNGQLIDNKPILKTIFEYAQSDFCVESIWEVTKVPNSENLPSMDFVSYSEYLISYRVKNNQLEFTNKFKAHEDRIYGIFFLKDKRLVTYSHDATIKIWEQDKGMYHFEQQLNGHRDAISYVIELEDGSLASASVDETIRIWQKNDNNFFKCVQVINLNSKVRELLEFDGSLITSSTGLLICLFKKNNDKWELKAEYPNASGPCSSARALQKLGENSFISCNLDEILIWEIENENLKVLQVIKEKERLQHFRLFKKFLSGVAGNKIYMYEDIDGKWEHLTTFTGHMMNDGQNADPYYYNFLSENEIVILSNEKGSINYKYYLTVYSNCKGRWDKKIIYCGELDQPSILFIEGNIVLADTHSSSLTVLTRCYDHQIDFISAKLYGDEIPAKADESKIDVPSKADQPKIDDQEPPKFEQPLSEKPVKLKRKNKSKFRCIVS